MNPYTDPENVEGNGAQFLFYPPAKNNSNLVYNAQNRFVPSQRLEVLRDSIEFYEYLLLLNNKTLPYPYNITYVDDLITSKVIIGPRSYLRDDNFIYNLRKVMGLFLGKELNYIPDLIPDCPICQTKDENSINHTYYLIFTNSNTNLLYNGVSYTPINWNMYNSTIGSGWFFKRILCNFHFIFT